MPGSEPEPRLRGLADALHAHEAMQQAGGWHEIEGGEPLRLGDRDARVAALRERLRASGDFRAEMQADPWFFDTAMAMALRGFQARHGLPPTGVLDQRTLDTLNVPLERRLEQLRASLVRLQWLPTNLGARFIWVNTAASTVQLVEQGQGVLEMRAIVGHPERPTPSFAAELRQVVFNPSWSVPARIAAEDLLPREIDQPGYLARNGFRVFAAQNRVPRALDPDTIDWQALDPQHFPYRLMQEPGPRNALGHIKFVMDNPFDIYLHDTPEQGLFNLPTRTLGSGCVRLEDARALATRLLATGREWTAADTDAHIATARTQAVDLAQHTPVYVVYLTAWVDESGTVHFRRDSYGRDLRMARFNYG